MNKAISTPIAIIIVLIVFTISIGLILLGYIYWPKGEVVLEEQGSKEQNDGMVGTLDETVFQAEEIITNNLPEYIIFLTDKYCPGSGSKTYQIPEGYFLHSCRYFRKEDGEYSNRIVLMNKNPWLIEENDSFDYYSSSVIPDFINDIKQTNDIRFKLFYDKLDPFFSYNKYLVTNQKGEEFIFLSKEAVDDYFRFEEYSLFDSGTSHSYGGTGLKIDNADSNFSIAYIGLKMNKTDMIKNLNMEVVFSSHDNYDYDIYGCDIPSEEDSFSWRDLLGIETVYACGPSNTTQLIGESNLILNKEENNVLWYKLENPIQLYNLPVGPCYEKDGSIKEACLYCGDCDNNCNSYSVDDQKHYECRYYCDYQCFKWENHPYNGIRMNVFYQPNDKKGFLKVQTANIILKDDISGNYFQPIFDSFYLENGVNSYNVYFGEDSCFSSEFLPIDCP